MNGRLKLFKTYIRVNRTCFRCYSQDGNVKKTVLHDFHTENGAKMVPFAGWSMPVQYKESASSAHNHVREKVGLFDVSHMLQTTIRGKDNVSFIEKLVVSDIDGLRENQGTLTLFTDDKGGILDDLIVNKTDSGDLYVVSNAGCADQDFAHMKENSDKFREQGKDVEVEVLCRGLLALQGPQMIDALQPGTDVNLTDLVFMTTREAKLFGVPGCRITRCGYTGEDGVELSIPAENTQNVAQCLINSKNADVKLIGLGARDSLRLEAGLCLYGNDITTETTPIEATLAWTIGKRRRQLADFPGADVILKQLKDKPSVKRVGFISAGAPVRAGTKIYDADGKTEIGSITSGCPSPTLKKNVSMGYVRLAHSKSGTPITFSIRGKFVNGQVSKMPFVPVNYYTK